MKRHTGLSVVLVVGAAMFVCVPDTAPRAAPPRGQPTPPPADAPAGAALPPPPAAQSPSEPDGATANAPATTHAHGVPPAADAKLRQLEEQVLDLKERVYRSRSRLLQLREQLLHDVVDEAKAIIVHRNEMGSAFSLQQVAYFLDGNRIYFQDNKDGVLDRQRTFQVFNDSVLPGNHVIAVEMVFRGNGGLFSYVDGYRFRLKSSYTFRAAKGRIVQIGVVAHERGGIATDLLERPDIRYEVRRFEYSKENLEALERGEVPAPARHGDSPGSR